MFKHTFGARAEPPLGIIFLRCGSSLLFDAPNPAWVDDLSKAVDMPPKDAPVLGAPNKEGVAVVGVADINVVGLPNEGAAFALAAAGVLPNREAPLNGLEEVEVDPKSPKAGRLGIDVSFDVPCTKAAGAGCAKDGAAVLATVGLPLPNMKAADFELGGILPVVDNPNGFSTCELELVVPEKKAFVVRAGSAPKVGVALLVDPKRNGLAVLFIGLPNVSVEVLVLATCNAGAWLAGEPKI